MPVQGTSSDIIKIAMINLHRSLREMGLKSRMILQVHDELIFETPLEEKCEMVNLIREKMSSAVQLSIPLKIDIKAGEDWGEMDSLDA